MKVLLIIIAISLLVSWIGLKAYLYSWDAKWRKNIKIGDECYFINNIGTRTYGEVAEIKDGRARIVNTDILGTTSSWHSIKSLRII